MLFDPFTKRKKSRTQMPALKTHLERAKKREVTPREALLWREDKCITCLIGRKEDFYLEAAELPVVQVSVWAGITKENKKKLVEGITRVFEELGVPREAVEVIIYEVPKTNWASGGQLHSENVRLRDWPVP